MLLTGTFVSMSAGNAGPDNGTTDHSSDQYISVAASQSGGTLASGRLSVTARAPVELPWRIWPIAVLHLAVPCPQVRYIPSLPAGDKVDPTNEIGCNAWPAGTFTGKAALISGICSSA